MDTERGFRIFSGLYSHLPKAAPNKKEFLSFYIFLLDQGPLAPLCSEKQDMGLSYMIQEKVIKNLLLLGVGVAK